MSQTMKKEKVSDIQTGILEQEITRIVKKIIHDKLVGLAADDIKIIVRELMPDLDRIISEKVKMHLAEIGMFMVETFSSNDD